MALVLDGYPTSFGNQRAAVLGHVGPAAYTVLDVASPPGALNVAGGDAVYAVDAGMKYLDFVAGGISDDGLYEVVAVPLRPSQKNAASHTAYGLVWYDAATRAEVTVATDLRGSTVRLFLLGPK